MNSDAIDAESRPLAVARTGAVTGWTPTFAVAVDEAIERKAEKRRFFEKVMDEGLHYGKIPGTGTKPTLLKPGAEMLNANMGLNPELSDAETPVRDYDGSGAGNGEPLFVYRRVCRIYRQTGPLEGERMLVAQAEGSCSSREAKYRWRNDKLKCAECGKATVIKARDFTNQGRDLGWVCWKKEGKSDGCNAQFPAGDPRIVNQVIGKIPNPDIADVENTILKMADKRALVAATLLATGCSDIFTQDVEDGAPENVEATPPAPPRSSQKPAQKPLPRTGHELPGDIAQRARQNALEGPRGGKEPISGGELFDDLPD